MATKDEGYAAPNIEGFCENDIEKEIKRTSKLVCLILFIFQCL